jgi:hypothetical protein
MKADPRFDPIRNAREIGSRNVPLFFLDDSAGSGSTDSLTVQTTDLATRLPWVRVALIAAAIWAIWQLSKK